MATSKKSAGRPRTGRKRYILRFTNTEIARIDELRKGKPRGQYLGRLALGQPLDPFRKYAELKKS